MADAVDGDGCMEHGRYIISSKTIPSHPMACEVLRTWSISFSVCGALEGQHRDRRDGRAEQRRLQSCLKDSVQFRRKNQSWDTFPGVNPLRMTNSTLAGCSGNS